MIKRIVEIWKRLIHKKLFPFLIITLGKKLLSLLLWTCKWQINGLETFKKVANQEKCILAFWHNRLVIAPYILTQYAPEFIYSALISNSRDGELISSLVQSYKIGRTIRVSHHSRHEALREFIQHIETKTSILVITPDGPRGPIYKVKEGIALAALETKAHTIRLNWTANKMWELNTWDKLRIPKPFSTINVFFENPIVLEKSDRMDRKQAQSILQNYMNNASL